MAGTMGTMTSKALGEMLVEERLITREQLAQAQQRQRETGGPVARFLLEMGLIDEPTLVEAIARQVGLPFVDLDATPVAPGVATLIPKELASKHGAVPVGLADGVLTVATADPANTAALDEIAALTGHAVRPALAVKRSITALIDAAHAAPAAPQSKAPGGVLREVARPAPAPAQAEERQISMHELLERALEENASDLHLTTGTPPVLRVHGHLVRLEDFPPLKPVELRRLIYSILTQRQREKLESDLELDLSYPLPSRARFRVNVYFQRDSIGAAFRRIPVEIKKLEDLGVPPNVGEFAHLPRGLVLVTGPTGSGKSTTLASIIDVVNRERSDHILTVEDPIEFLHQHKKSIVNQREVGGDTRTFASALKSALRQDPDVILVGEMRDLETISTAITAAETGHLVFATLHTQSAPSTIDRVIDVFPPHQQQQVRVQLAGTIQGIVTQNLLTTADGKGRVVACEVLVATPAIRNLIREGKTHQIFSAMQAGGKYGMQTMDHALATLYRKGTVTYDAALERCTNVEDFMRLAGRTK